MLDISHLIIDFCAAIKHWVDNHQGWAFIIVLLVIFGAMVMMRKSKGYKKSSGTTETGNYSGDDSF